jgi:hypothetical protein
MNVRAYGLGSYIKNAPGNVCQGNGLDRKTRMQVSRLFPASRRKVVTLLSAQWYGGEAPHILDLGTEQR